MMAGSFSGGPAAPAAKEEEVRVDKSYNYFTFSSSS